MQLPCLTAFSFALLLALACVAPTSQFSQHPLWLRPRTLSSSSLGMLKFILCCQRLAPKNSILTTGAFPTGPPLSAKKRSYPRTRSACIYPALSHQLPRSEVSAAAFHCSSNTRLGSCLVQGDDVGRQSRSMRRERCLALCRLLVDLHHGAVLAVTAPVHPAALFSAHFYKLWRLGQKLVVR